MPPFLFAFLPLRRNRIDTKSTNWDSKKYKFRMFLVICMKNVARIAESRPEFVECLLKGA